VKLLAAVYGRHRFHVGVQLEFGTHHPKVRSPGTAGQVLNAKEPSFTFVIGGST